MLLGIKYEAARIGEVGEAALAGIEEQIRREVGDGWESDDRKAGARSARTRRARRQAFPNHRPDTPAVAKAIWKIGLQAGQQVQGVR